MPNSNFWSDRDAQAEGQNGQPAGGGKNPFSKFGWPEPGRTQTTPGRGPVGWAVSIVFLATVAGAGYLMMPGGSAATKPAVHHPSAASAGSGILSEIRRLPGEARAGWESVKATVRESDLKDKGSPEALKAWKAEYIKFASGLASRSSGELNAGDMVALKNLEMLKSRIDDLDEDAFLAANEAKFEKVYQQNTASTEPGMISQFFGAAAQKAEDQVGFDIRTGGAQVGAGMDRLSYAQGCLGSVVQQQRDVCSIYIANQIVKNQDRRDR